jgi:predicted transcriptional regulator
MTTLKVGIASYEEMKARTMAVARGEQRLAPDEPKVRFTSTESFAKVLSAGNRELLRVIAEKAPGSLDELARITGKGQVQSFPHAADHGGLRPGPPRTR